MVPGTRGALLAVLPMRKLKPRVVRYWSQGHTAAAPPHQDQSGLGRCGGSGQNTAGGKPGSCPLRETPFSPRAG